MKKHFPLILLLGIVLFRLLLVLHMFLSESLGLFYDEIVLFNIIKTSEDLRTTLFYEPKPIGGYLVLRFLTFGYDFPQSRLIIITANYIVMIASILWAYKNNVIQKYKLTYGLAIYFASFTFLALSAYIKIAIISQSIAIFLVLYFLKCVDTPFKKIKYSQLTVLTTLFLFLFFVDYSAALFFGMIYLPWLLFGWLHHRRNRFLGTILVSGFIFIIYFWIYLFEQMVNNMGRGIWFEYGSGGIMISLGQMISFNYNLSPAYDLLILAFLLFAWFSKYTKLELKNVDGKIVKSLSYIILISIIIVAYLTHLIVIQRYVYIGTLIFSAIIGWGMESIERIYPLRKGVWVGLNLAVIAVIFGYSWSIHKSLYIANDTSYKYELRRVLELGEEIEGEVGFITEVPMLSHIMKINNLSYDSKIIPVTQYVDGTNISKEKMTKELFAVDQISARGLPREDQYDLVKANLDKSELSSFIYSISTGTFTHLYFANEYDPVSVVLRENCDSTKIYREIGYLIVAEGCNLN